ncbi:hypothetical protein OS493_019724 [Desmophyllum pertusum]|uniref:Uncharacterized protein n=1 Tax=Desmophyllum pertusum TaxID=174260 RepID=A0A9W9YZK5_9CNID|nr:hypothetical protein OS493_019724 [Desmophyllum pertusum]
MEGKFLLLQATPVMSVTCPMTALRPVGMITCYDQEILQKILPSLFVTRLHFLKHKEFSTKSSDDMEEDKKK